LDVVAGGEGHWSLVETAILHGSQDFSVVFNQLLKRIAYIRRIRGFRPALGKRNARAALMVGFLRDCCTFLLLDW
jgi:hypothetical protein